jgi:hypothetical protein
MGLDTKTYWLTDRQSQCDFDFVSWKSACEDETGRLVWNGRQPGSQLRVEFCIGGCENRTRAEEAEESPFLKAVARERLVKTQQAEKKKLSMLRGEL